MAKYRDPLENGRQRRQEARLQAEMRASQARRESDFTDRIQQVLGNQAIGGLSGYVDAPAYVGIDNSNQRQGLLDNPMPIFRTARDAQQNNIVRDITFKFHPAHERWLVYENGNTYLLPGKDLKKNMIYELTIPQHDKIKTISADWAHIVKPGRTVDQEIVGELARTLFGESMEIVFSKGTPAFDKYAYERLINRMKMESFQRELVWDELTAALQNELVPAEFSLFFNGLTDALKTQLTKEQYASIPLAEVKSCLMSFATLDYIQRAIGPSELEPYKNTLLFVRLVGGFYFETPQKLIIYDYPAAVHSSAEFGIAPVLHNPEGAAIAYGDGTGVYAIEGFEFPARVIERRDSITVAEIEAEQNMERRRILTDQMGISRYLHETKAQVIDMDSVRVMTVGDDDRRMPRALIQAKDGRRFMCGTDGSTKRVYYMPVPRDCDTCKMAHEAIAGPVGIRHMTLKSTNRGWNPQLDLGLDENDCIAQS